MEDYDKAVRESKYQQPRVDEKPTTPTEVPKEPIIKEEQNPSPKQEEPSPKQEEPSQETPTEPLPTPTETITEKTPKPSLAERRLGTNLDGGYWQCEEQHGRRLRVRTTEVTDGDELKDSWDNIANIGHHQEQEEEDCPKEIRETNLGKR